MVTQQMISSSSGLIKKILSRNTRTSLCHSSHSSRYYMETKLWAQITVRSFLLSQGNCIIFPGPTATLSKPLPSMELKVSKWGYLQEKTILSTIYMHLHDGLDQLNMFPLFYHCKYFIKATTFLLTYKHAQNLYKWCVFHFKQNIFNGSTLRQKTKMIIWLK